MKQRKRLFFVPHGALSIELSQDYHERTRLYGLSHMIGIFGVAAGLLSLHFMQQAEDKRLFAFQLSMFAAAAIALLVIWTTYLLPERAAHQGRAFKNPFQTFLDILRNRARQTVTHRLWYRNLWRRNAWHPCRLRRRIRCENGFAGGHFGCLSNSTIPVRPRFGFVFQNAPANATCGSSGPSSQRYPMAAYSLLARGTTFMFTPAAFLLVLARALGRYCRPRFKPTLSTTMNS